MTSDFDFGTGILIWGIVVLAIVFTQRAQATLGVGLVLAYLANLAMIHLPGAFLYLNPDYAFYRRLWIQLGFEQSTWAVAAFGAGAVITLWVLHLTRRLSVGSEARFPQAVLFNPWVHRLYVIFGLFSFFVLSPIARNVPTLSAVVSVMNQLLLLGICLGIWQAWPTRNWWTLFWWIVVLGLLPVITLVFQGFLGFGISALLTSLAFFASFFRPRVLVIVIGAAFVLLGASAFVTYFRDRTQIREVVWGGESIEERVFRVGQTFADFEWFDLNNTRHLNAIDQRLNQNWIVGAAVENLARGKAEYQDGATLLDALIAPIPRILWPDKPVRAGSGNLVTDATGVAFSKNTSVGVGQVLEFYYNFGATGVILGSVLWGIALALLDGWASRYLLEGNSRRFTLFFLVGLGLIQPGGSLVDIAATSAAAVLAAFVINEFLVPFFLDAVQLEPAPALRPKPPGLPRPKPPTHGWEP